MLDVLSDAAVTGETLICFSASHKMGFLSLKNVF